KKSCARVAAALCRIGSTGGKERRRCLLNEVGVTACDIMDEAPIVEGEIDTASVEDGVDVGVVEGPEEELREDVEGRRATHPLLAARFLERAELLAAGHDDREGAVRARHETTQPGEEAVVALDVVANEVVELIDEHDESAVALADRLEEAFDGFC